MLLNKTLVIVIAVSLFMLCVGFGSKNPKKFVINGFAQGTTYKVIYLSDKMDVNEEELSNLLQEIDYSLSIYNPKSLISKFNTGEDVLMDKHLSYVVKKSLKVSKQSNGVFDITVLPLLDFWGLYGKESQQKQQKSLEQLLQNVGYKKLKTENGFLKNINKQMQIDVNGIAQGYSVDVLADFLDKKNIKNYCIEIGGEFRIKGKSINNNLFKIGIETPNNEELKNIVSFKKGAITTSGNYRKYIESNGEKISHLINPKTGKSFDNSNISVTVFSKKAVFSDAYDNVLMAMPIDKAFDFLKKNKKIEAYFIYKQNGVLKDTCTKKFKKLIIKE